MRKLFAFLVWLFSFWTWKDFFLRRLRSPACHPGSGETAEHLSSQDGQQESELARFLSSLPDDGRCCDSLCFNPDSKVRTRIGRFGFTLSHGTGVEASHRESGFTLSHGTRVEASYREFLESVASSEIVFREEVHIYLQGDDSCKHVEAFADKLRQSGNTFRKLNLCCEGGSAIRFAECLFSVLLGNNAIQDLSLDFTNIEWEMGKELAVEVMAIISMLHNLRILKSFHIGVRKLDGEGMEQVMKPFQGPPTVLEDLQFYYLTSDAQLEHISSMLASSTSLKITSGLEGLQ